MTLRILTHSLVLASALILTPIARAEVSSVTVVKLQPELDHLKRTFETRGTSAVSEELRRSLLDDEKLEAWRAFAKEGQVKVSVEIHKSEAEAVQYLQNRLNKMGLPNLKIEGVETAGRPDPHAIDDEDIKYHKWIRYGAGPGITLAASLFNMPQVTTGTFSDYMFVLAPAAAAGMATIVLELVFANPKINNNVWKPLFSSPIQGRINNVMVNFAIGLGLWAVQVGGAHIPQLFGAGVVPVNLISFKQAIYDAAWGAVLFNMFFGQYQTDLAYAEKEGSLTTSQRYKLETTGGVLVGGGRVAYWTLPHSVAYLGLMAEIGFAMLKTFPQAIKNYISDPLNDARVKRLLHGQPGGRPTMFEQCGQALGAVGLVNLPRMEKILRSPKQPASTSAAPTMREPVSAAM